MTLPNSRQITIGTGTTIPPTLLNNIQDMIIGGRHGSITKQLSGKEWRGLDQTVTNPNAIVTGLNSSDEHFLWFNMRLNDVIERVQVGCNDDVGASQVLDMRMRTKTTLQVTSTGIGSNDPSDNGGADQLVDIVSAGLPITVAAGIDYCVGATPQSSFNWNLYQVELTFSR